MKLMYLVKNVEKLQSECFSHIQKQIVITLL